MKKLFIFALAGILYFCPGNESHEGLVLAKQTQEPEELTPLVKERNFENNRKVAYLTFDDGPSINTLAILDILDRYKIKATFFVMAHEEEEAIPRYKAMVERGHVVALHTYTHDYSIIYRSSADFFQDIAKLEGFLSSQVGIKSKILRFPGGSMNYIARSRGGGSVMKQIIEESKTKGYKYYDWNVDSTDGISPTISEQTIVRSVLKEARGKKKAIILLHDINMMKNTVRALPTIIEALQKQGYDFDVIDESTPILQF